jgi:hypothetical protein
MDLKYFSFTIKIPISRFADMFGAPEVVAINGPSGELDRSFYLWLVCHQLSSSSASI